LTWNVSRQLELTAAARYDDERYDNTTYTDRTQTTVVPVLSKDGTPVDTQRERGSAFQPKGQVSFHFTDDVMGYATVSRGFRAGYFNTGAFTLPEHTTNYELGLKSALLDRRLVANVAAFHIDYSDQQFSSIVAQYPFRLAVTIPKTKIDGVEFESTAIASRFVSFGLGLGYLSAKVADGSNSPAAPRFNANASVDFTCPVFLDWKARLHVDDRYNSLQYLATENQQPVGAKNYVNLRGGVQNERYDIAAFVRNATDERQATFAGSDNFAGGYIRYQNAPRSYGVEVKVMF
jgi:iron complex outermembrane receptor protein